MRRTRKCCGDDFIILSGDDGMTYEMMIDPEIKAAGTISVTSNVAPKALSRMVQLLNEGNQSEANALMLKLQPLFSLVTVATTEKTPYGNVLCKARNPAAYKAMMSILGMPSGGCRPPLGRLTQNGVNVVLDGLRGVYSLTRNPAADRGVFQCRYRTAVGRPEMLGGTSTTKSTKNLD